MSTPTLIRSISGSTGQVPSLSFGLVSRDRRRKSGRRPFERSCHRLAFLLANAPVKHAPPAALVDLLATLGLATARQVRGARGRVRRLGGAPQFDSLWVDALAQSRLLTPWQAAEINANRGASLKVGPFVLCEPLASLGYAALYRARRIDGRMFVRLSVADKTADVEEAERRLTTLVEKAEALRVGPLNPVAEHGRDGDRVWAASAYFNGRSAQRLLAERGRFPPSAVLEIARQMLVGLAACERAELPHGDLTAGQIWLDRRGRVWLPEPGLRGALGKVGWDERCESPQRPDCCDSQSHPTLLSTEGGEPRGELYACGALWWHLLTGRPLVGPSSTHAPEGRSRGRTLPDIRHLAPDTPAPLADVITACLATEPPDRPESAAAVVGPLGEPTRKGQRQVARLLRPGANPAKSFTFAFAGRRRYPRPSTWLAAAAGATLALAIIAWPAVSQRLDQPGEARPQIVGAGTTVAREVAAVAPQGEATARSANAVERPGVEARNDVQPAGPIVQTAWREPEAPPVSAGEPAPPEGASTRRGETVMSDGQLRRLVEVPPEGLEVTEEATFENVDFVASQPLASNAAMLVLRGPSSRTVFRGCSFQTSDDVASSDLPAAIRLNDGVDAVASNADLSTGTLEIRDSVFRRVKAAVSCRVAGGTVMRLDNVLHLGPGPGIEIDRFPEADEVLAVGLSRVTLRGARSMIEVGCDRLPAFPGRLEVDAADCAFILPAAAAIVEYHGATRPGPLLKGVRWSGQGSVLSPRSRLALWRMPEGRMLAAADEAVPIEGVVRAEVGFAGGADEGPAASRVVRWQAPLRSPQPPGVDGSLLHLPEANGGNPRSVD
jgi:hypothetical protein